MKVYSIYYQSSLYPEKVALGSIIAEDQYKASSMGMEELTKQQGNLNWNIKLINSIDLNNVKIPIKEEPIKETKNWIIKTIIDNKDKKLKNAVKKYLTQNELLFINDKIACKP